MKGVPVFYLPVMYYPINKEDRATGFLIPIYGIVDDQGQTLSNAFFWAINRSQDATFYHDWYSKTGQGFGGEYRYVAGARVGGQQPHFQAIDEHDAIYEQPDGIGDGASRQLAATRSAATWRSGCPAHMRCDGQRRLLLQRHGAAALPAEHLSATNSTRRFGVQPHGQLGALLDQRHGRSQRRRSATRRRCSLYGSPPRVTVHAAARRRSASCRCTSAPPAST